MPLVSQNCHTYLFADDTSTLGVNCSVTKLQADLDSIFEWLKSNKLTLNVKKTCQLNIRLANSASNPNPNLLLLNNQVVETTMSCKYLGVYLDNRLSFKIHIEYVKHKLAKQCGILAKLRHYVPKNVLLRYYSSNIKPIIQYGLLAYGCASYRTLEPILIMQKKIVRVILFSKIRESVVEYFEKMKISTVHELYVYELLKFVLRSLNRLHRDEYLNNMYEFETPRRSTRRAQQNFLKVQKSKRCIEKYSLKSRGSKLMNILIENGIVDPIQKNMSNSFFVSIVHKIRDNFILAKSHLINQIFD